MTEQATPPTDAEQVQTLRTANAMLRARVGELEERWQVVTGERDQARAELRTRTQDYTRLIEEAQKLMRPQAEWEAEIERLRLTLQSARIYVDRMTIQVGPVAHDEIAPAKRVLALIDAALTGAAGEGEK